MAFSIAGRMLRCGKVSVKKIYELEFVWEPRGSDILSEGGVYFCGRADMPKIAKPVKSTKKPANTTKAKKIAASRATPIPAGPRAERPHMPGYGITASADGMLPWSWAEERLNASRIFWLTTITPKGEPHVMPIWGIWAEGKFYFSTGTTSVKARNLAANARCVITNDNADQAMILHGDARRFENKARIAKLSKIYKAKYDFPLDPRMGTVFELTPTLAFGQPHDDYAKSATRWRF